MSYVKKAWTDYPFAELGDEPNKEAPIRECEVLEYDNDKYCKIKINDMILSVKRAYLYRVPGRCGHVKPISLNRVPRPKRPKIVHVANAAEAFEYIRTLKAAEDGNYI